MDRTSSIISFGSASVQHKEMAHFEFAQQAAHQTHMPNPW
jgi:hypothetical protein